jgi:hypothetical protein
MPPENHFGAQTCGQTDKICPFCGRSRLRKRYRPGTGNVLCCPCTPVQRPHRYFLDFFIKANGFAFSAIKRAGRGSASIASSGKDRLRNQAPSVDPSKYIRQEVEKFWITNLLDEFRKNKIKEIAPSDQDDYERRIRRAKDLFGTRDIRELRKMHIIECCNRLIPLRGTFF